MTKEFIPYQQALDLEKLGFDGDCFAFYNGKFLDFKICDNGGLEYPQITVNKDIGQCPNAPLYQQAFKWFREKYGLYSEIFVDDNKTFGFLISSFIEEGRLDKPITRQFSSYEEAELGCVRQLIEIVKNK